MEERTVDSWAAALPLARTLGHDAAVRVPKASEPTLPELDLQQSNFPWSMHKGALSVYRERARGDHLQVREYPGFWEVSLDRHNPHYRPLEHATLDVPGHVLVAMGALSPRQAYRWVFGDRLPAAGDAVGFAVSTAGAVPKVGLEAIEAVARYSSKGSSGS